MSQEETTRVERIGIQIRALYKKYECGWDNLRSLAQGNKLSNEEREIVDIAIFNAYLNGVATI